jgi:DNA-binding transcriptional LysR family regulator
MRRRQRRNHTTDAPPSNAEGESASGLKPTIPTDLLRTFVAICELRSFTKAAQLFELTQPAVSAHLRRLESLIGADLIEKNMSGVNLTECGADVLRDAQRVLAINDQIVSGGGLNSQPQVIRLGIPNLYAPNKLARILRECGTGPWRLQLRCDHSPGLLRSVRAGYLDLAAAISNGDELDDALASWTEELVWARAPDFVLRAGEPVPLVGSPNLLLSDRVAMEKLERAGLRYEVVFTAFDTQARRAAAAAGIGYLVIPRPLVTEPLVTEAPGVLPELPRARMGIVARDDFNTAPLADLISAIERVLVF